MRRSSPVASSAALVLLVSGCGGPWAAVTGACDPGSRISVSHASEGGEATPLAAAEALGTWAADGPLRAPRDGWEVVEEQSSSVLLRGDDVEAVVVRLLDDTWTVDEARCTRD